MDAVNYLKVKTKMTEKCEISCRNCPLNAGDRSLMGCVIIEAVDPERAVAIVKKWQEENIFRVPKDAPIDTKVLVSDDGNNWHKKHFAGFEEETMFAWDDGCTSFTAGSRRGWKYVKLAEDEV